MIETIQHEALRWMHITNPTEDEYRYLLDEFHFHPLDIEDCRGTNQRPKIDEYDDYYFLILHFPYFDKNNKDIRIREVKLFWGKDYIITIGKAHWVVKKLFEEMQEDLAEDDEDVKEKLSSSDLLLYHILDRLMLETYTLIMRVGAEVDLINYDIFNRKARSIIELISTTRKNIIQRHTNHLWTLSNEQSLLRFQLHAQLCLRQCAEHLDTRFFQRSNFYNCHNQGAKIQNFLLIFVFLLVYSYL